MASRIAFYRLREVIKDHEILGQTRRNPLWESIRCARLQLSDKNRLRLLTLAEARALTA